MSTDLYLECKDHDPPLTSDGEVGQHLYDLVDIGKMIAQKDAIIALLATDAPLSWDSYFASNTARFLARHPRCNIGIVDEYGKRHDIPGETETP